MIPAMLLVFLAASANAETSAAQETPPVVEKKEPLALPGDPGAASWRKMAEDAEDRLEKMKPAGRNEVLVGVGSLTSRTQVSGVNGSDDLSSAGTFFGLGFLHNVTPLVAVGLQGEVLRPGDHSSQTLITNNTTITHFESYDALGIARLQYRCGGFRPYAWGGLGIYTADMNVDSRPLPGSVWAGGGNDTRTLVNASATGMALAFQAGLDYDLGANVLLGGFFSYRHLASTTYSVTDDARALGVGGVSGYYDAIMFGGQIAGRF